MDNGALRFDSWVAIRLLTYDSIPRSESLSLSFDLRATTSGPPRDGFARYVTLTDYNNLGSAAFNYSASISGLDSCTFLPLCETGGVRVPFSLGVPFDINLFASITADTTFCTEEHNFICGDRDAIYGYVYAALELQLFEASGEPVEIIAANTRARGLKGDRIPAETPEPATWGFVGLGLLAGVARRVVLS
jgi:hypothetical protein